MTKYYVYAVAQEPSRQEYSNDRTYAYVEDPTEFALEGFDPATMEYTGVVVEASTPTEANDVYNRPTEYSGAFLMAEEPKATALKQRAYRAKEDIAKSFMPELKKKLQELNEMAAKAAAKMLAVRMAHQLTILNATLSELSRRIRLATTDNSELDAEGIYERLKETYLKRFMQEFKYTTDAPDKDDNLG